MSYPLSRFEVQKYCKIEPKFNGIFLINNLPKINDNKSWDFCNKFSWAQIHRNSLDRFTH